MSNYIKNTKHAVKGIFELLNKEKILLNEEQRSFRIMDSAARNTFESIKKNSSPTLLIELCGLESVKEKSSIKIDEIRNSIYYHNQTYNILAGSLLQIAKQGISIEYGCLTDCPNGRKIGSSEYLKNVIWQSRNQTMHYEEGTYHKNVIDCFLNLEKDFGSHFKLKSTNLALNVIDVLGWNSYTEYENDMLTLFL